MDFAYKNIVVAVDGSEASEVAFQKSLNIAKRNKARLILTHIVDSRTFATAEAYDRTLAERAEDYAKELLDNYTDKAKAAGIENLVRCVEYGSPKVKIAKDVASDFKADLIICGATGMNAVERFLIGSVSESITRYANCDVLVVR
ncbi:universal stress protein UspA [Virgibacillus dakarensis]|uniref:Universal stress protein n=1 Tax=Lentibacillus populi TaxID=1827502 RepID=A0A9W5X3J2_9BACI|nr:MULTISPECIES: universal stress protein [Bacillaceae]MBT2216587.1 universal stress protein [Virgibacillus dakarensis]MTW84309.1 universal stress protein UspA [Virgibacillus dakarensis]GGB27411.1 universal stress protein [Lentibacillus populi]